MTIASWHCEGVTSERREPRIDRGAARDYDRIAREPAPLHGQVVAEVEASLVPGDVQPIHDDQALLAVGRGHDLSELGTGLVARDTYFQAQAERRGIRFGAGVLAQHADGAGH